MLSSIRLTNSTGRTDLFEACHSWTDALEICPLLQSRARRSRLSHKDPRDSRRLRRSPYRFPVSPPLTGSGSPIADEVLAALPFKVGEQLNYQVYLGGNQEVVGLASFQVRARSRYFDHDGLMLTVTAQTT